MTRTLASGMPSVAAALRRTSKMPCVESYSVRFSPSPRAIVAWGSIGLWCSHRRRVLRAHDDLRRPESAVGIATQRVRRFAHYRLRRVALRPRGQYDAGALRGVADANPCGGIGRALERVGDDERDRLAVVAHDVVLQQREEAIHLARLLLLRARGVLVRHHKQHARQRAGHLCVDLRDATFRHVAEHHHAVHDVRTFSTRQRRRACQASPARSSHRIRASPSC